MLVCPSHMAIVEISTPDDNKFIATECRNVCGVMFFSDKVRAAFIDSSTIRSIRDRTPDRVSGFLFLLMNKALPLQYG